MGLSHLILSFSLLLDKLIDQFLILRLIILRFLIVALKFDNFGSSSESLLLLKILDSLLPGQGSLKKLLIPRLVGLLLDEPEFSFGGVVVYELDVPFSIENEFLSVGFFFSGNFYLPLLLEHLLFFQFALLINLSNCCFLIILPVENSHGLLDFLGFCRGFFNLALMLLLVI